MFLVCCRIGVSVFSVEVFVGGSGVCVLCSSCVRLKMVSVMVIISSVCSVCGVLLDSVNCYYSLFWYLIWLYMKNSS